MQPQDFFKELMDAQELIKEEKYNEAIVKLEKLREIEKNGDFDYTLTHKLYQLISNSQSLYNQKIISNHIEQISKEMNSISFNELNQILRDDSLDIDDSILRREIELLILRDYIQCKIEGNKIIFSLT